MKRYKSIFNESQYDLTPQNINAYIDDLISSLTDALNDGEDPEEEYDRIYRDLRKEYNLPQEGNSIIFKAEDKAIKEFIKKNKRKIDKIKDED